jgi:RNA polymerase sigma-54 factor
MKAGLQLRQSQHLALTPQLQQSIRLLQLSTLELNQEIEQILAMNPMLERLDDPLQGHERLGGDGSLRSSGQVFDDPAGRAGVGEGDSARAADEPATGRDEALLLAPDDRGNDDYETPGDGALWSGAGGDGGGHGGDDEDRAPEQVASQGRSLQAHLEEQLAGARCTPKDRALVRLLIGEVEEDGYIRSSIEEIAAALPPEAGIDPDEWTTALRLLQSFEPTGVGARDLAECLRLQLPQAVDADVEPEVIALARRLIDDHLDLLGAREFSKLRKFLHCDEEALRQVQRLIQRLDPRPGRRFGVDAAAYVIPDIVVRRTRQGWRVTLNPDVVPKLRINDLYARILRSHRGPAATGMAAAGAGVGQGDMAVPRIGSAPPSVGATASNGQNPSHSLASQLQEARWLVKNVQQRFETILRVSQEIVDRQKAFFSHGAVAMRPLVLREVAQAVGLHESTVSRVTTQKYMLTPFGTVELKYFFGSHVATESGGAASSTAIRALIRQLVDEEDTTEPLSDSRIADLLGEQGIVVARRTVAKYRESLRIAPVAQRKAL